MGMGSANSPKNKMIMANVIMIQSSVLSAAPTSRKLLAKNLRSLYTFIIVVLISARVMFSLPSLSKILKASLASSTFGYAG